MYTLGMMAATWGGMPNHSKAQPGTPGDRLTEWFGFQQITRDAQFSIRQIGP